MIFIERRKKIFCNAIYTPGGPLPVRKNILKSYRSGGPSGPLDRRQFVKRDEFSYAITMRERMIE